MTEELTTFLRSFGADTTAHGNGRSLLVHLQGTARITDAWQQSPVIRHAALFHSVYGTDVFKTVVITVESARERVRAMIGVDSERLVYLFGTLNRAAFWETIRTTKANEPVLVRRYSDRSSERIEPSERFAMIVLYLANSAEQVCAQDGGPATWLADLADKARFLNASFGRVPPILECIRKISHKSEAALLQRYRRAIAAISSDRVTAAAVLHDLAESCPWLPEPHAWLAYLALESLQIESALEQADLAQRWLHAWGTPWDKRLDEREWTSFVAAVKRRSIAARDAAALPRGLVDEPMLAFAKVRDFAASDRRATDVADRDVSRRRFYQFVDQYIETTNATTTIYPGLAARPWHDPAEFPIVAALEDGFASIVAELATVDANAFHGETESIDRDGAWDVFMLYERGKRHDRNCALVPTATRIVETFETVRTHAGLIYFSRMKSGTHIREHRGPTNVRLRCHLPIAVPNGDCAIRVGGEMRHWETGRCLVFDDHFEHEAWNRTDGERIVLIVDLWNSALTAEEISMLTRFQNRTMRQSNNLQRYWANNDRARRVLEDHLA